MPLYFVFRIACKLCFVSECCSNKIRWEAHRAERGAQAPGLHEALHISSFRHSALCSVSWEWTFRNSTVSISSYKFQRRCVYTFLMSSTDVSMHIVLITIVSLKCTEKTIGGFMSLSLSPFVHPSIRHTLSAYITPSFTHCLHRLKH